MLKNISRRPLICLSRLEKLINNPSINIKWPLRKPKHIYKIILSKTKQLSRQPAQCALSLLQPLQCQKKMTGSTHWCASSGQVDETFPRQKAMVDRFDFHPINWVTCIDHQHVVHGNVLRKNNAAIIQSFFTELNLKNKTTLNNCRKTKRTTTKCNQMFGLESCPNSLRSLAKAKCIASTSLSLCDAFWKQSRAHWTCLKVKVSARPSLFRYCWWVWGHLQFSFKCLGFCFFCARPFGLMGFSCATVPNFFHKLSKGSW